MTSAAILLAVLVLAGAGPAYPALSWAALVGVAVWLAGVLAWTPRRMGHR